jgi:hypothetical protein
MRSMPVKLSTACAIMACAIPFLLAFGVDAQAVDDTPALGRQG